MGLDTARACSELSALTYLSPSRPYHDRIEDSRSYRSGKIAGVMNPYTINPLESEVAFEERCLELLKRHWSRKGLERFAKTTPGF